MGPKAKSGVLWIRVAVEQELDRLPEVCTNTLYWRKCDLIYQHIYDNYFGQGRSIYAEPS